MYQFKRTSASRKGKMVFSHPLFQKGHRDLLLKMERTPVGPRKLTTMDAKIDDSYQEGEEESFKPAYTHTDQMIDDYAAEISFTQATEQSSVPTELSTPQNTITLNHDNEKQMSSEESKFAADFRLLLKIASNSKGNIEGTNLPVGFYEFQQVVERMLGFDEIDAADIKLPYCFLYEL